MYDFKDVDNWILDDLPPLDEMDESMDSSNEGNDSDAYRMPSNDFDDSGKTGNGSKEVIDLFELTAKEMEDEPWDTYTPIDEEDEEDEDDEEEEYECGSREVYMDMLDSPMRVYDTYDRGDSCDFRDNDELDLDVNPSYFD